jgi:hypothetical protein
LGVPNSKRGKIPMQLLVKNDDRGTEEYTRDLGKFWHGRCIYYRYIHFPEGKSDQYNKEKKEKE